MFGQSDGRGRMSIGHLAMSNPASKTSFGLPPLSKPFVPFPHTARVGEWMGLGRRRLGDELDGLVEGGDDGQALLGNLRRRVVGRAVGCRGYYEHEGIGRVLLPEGVALGRRLEDCSVRRRLEGDAGLWSAGSRLVWLHGMRRRAYTGASGASRMFCKSGGSSISL